MPGPDTGSPSQGTPPPPPSLGMLQPGSCILRARRPATPIRSAVPSESQQTPCPRRTLLSYPLPGKQKVPAALPCPSAGSPNPLSPGLTHYPHWRSHTLGFSAPCGPVEPSLPASSLFLGCAEGQRALSKPAPMRSLGADDTLSKRLQLCCLLCWGMLSFFWVT